MMNLKESQDSDSDTSVVVLLSANSIMIANARFQRICAIGVCDFSCVRGVSSLSFV